MTLYPEFGVLSSPEWLSAASGIPCTVGSWANIFAVYPSGPLAQADGSRRQDSALQVTTERPIPTCNSAGIE
jgi:hypothetical protein